jgi:hypothetical protein
MPAKISKTKDPSHPWRITWPGGKTLDCEDLPTARAILAGEAIPADGLARSRYLRDLLERHGIGQRECARLLATLGHPVGERTVRRWVRLDGPPRGRLAPNVAAVELLRRHLEKIHGV